MRCRTGLMGLAVLSSIGLLVLDAATARGQARRGRGRVVRYRAVEVTDGGTIEGHVIWKGDLPDSYRLKVPVPAAQQTHCSGPEIGLDCLHVDEKTRGVEFAVVYLDGITQGKALPERDIDFMTGKKATLNQIKCHYVPRVMVVRRGSTIAISSSDDVLHNVNARMRLTQLFNLAFPTKGQVIDDPARTNVGRKPGIITLKCNAGHFWMNGSIHVVAHPYYVVTDKAGAFKLTDVPPGEYTLAVWHENVTPRLSKNAEGNVADVIYGRPILIKEKVKVEAKKTATLDVDLSAPQKQDKK